MSGIAVFSAMFRLGGKAFRPISMLQCRIAGLFQGRERLVRSPRRLEPTQEKLAQSSRRGPAFICLSFSAIDITIDLTR